MVKNHCLAKSINDASWYQFRIWIEYFGKVFEKVTVAVNPAYTSQECSSCGKIVKKTLSTRTHVCQCGCSLDRDENAARNILGRGLGTAGHTGTLALNASNALGELTSTLVGEILSQASRLVEQRIPARSRRGVSRNIFRDCIRENSELSDKSLLRDRANLKSIGGRRV
jgi:Putative transposase DNA-binding domain